MLIANFEASCIREDLQVQIAAVAIACHRYGADSSAALPQSARDNSSSSTTQLIRLRLLTGTALLR